MKLVKFWMSASRCLIRLSAVAFRIMLFVSCREWSEENGVTYETCGIYGAISHSLPHVLQVLRYGLS